KRGSPSPLPGREQYRTWLPPITSNVLAGVADVKLCVSHVELIKLPIPKLAPETSPPGDDPERSRQRPPRCWLFSCATAIATRVLALLSWCSADPAAMIGVHCPRRIVGFSLLRDIGLRT